MKSEFTLTLNDNEKNRQKSAFLSRLEIMFDDVENPLPDSWYSLNELVPWGSKVRIILEVVE